MTTPTTELTGAALLREAARVMRERAREVYPPDETWDRLVMAHSGTALMHALGWTPAVALAVADWVDACGNDLHRNGGHVGFADEPASVEGALAVARTYLGLPS